MAPLVPAHLRLDRYAGGCQVRSPPLDVPLWQSKREMARTVGTMRHHRRPAGRNGWICGRIWVEEEDHPLAAAKEDVAARLPGDDFEAQHMPIEALCGIQVGAVQRTLQHAGRLQSRCRHA